MSKRVFKNVLGGGVDGISYVGLGDLTIRQVLLQNKGDFLCASEETFVCLKRSGEEIIPSNLQGKTFLFPTLEEIDSFCLPEVGQNGSRKKRWDKWFRVLYFDGRKKGWVEDLLPEFSLWQEDYTVLEVTPEKFAA